MIHTTLLLYRKLGMSLLLALLPFLAIGQSLIQGPRWYDEGKLTRRINIQSLTEGQELPLFKQCLDGQFHVAIQLKYDIEGRQPFINWEYGLNVELIRLQSNAQGYLPNDGTRQEQQLLVGASGADANGLVPLKVSNNKEQTFVASALYGQEQQYISCNEEENDVKNEYISLAFNRRSRLANRN